MVLSARRLNEIVVELVSRPGHEKIRALMFELLVYGLGASSTDIYFERQLPEVRGRLDALLGQTVFEFKRDLRRERRSAEEELGRYLPERERETGEHFIGIATDGAEFVPYEVEDDELVALPGFRPSADDPGALLLWLDAAVSLQPDLKPEPAIVEVELGRGSLAYRRALAGLNSLWESVRTRPDVQLKRQLWADFLEVVYGTHIDADQLFLQHTYLTVVAKTMATRVLGIALPRAEDLLSGQAFRQAGIAGAVESDFFDWILEAESGAELVARISRQVARFRLEAVEHDVLKGLYESLIDPDQRHDLGEYYTPDWLAARICEQAIARPLEQRVLDPACGSGTFLFQAVRRFLEAADDARMSPAESLKSCVERVIGIDVHPVAVLVARVTYLLALGEERLQDRPESIALPVYLGDSLQWNTRQLFALRDVVISVPDGPELHFPEWLADDPHRFDETVTMMMEMSGRDASSEAFGAWLRRDGTTSERDLTALIETYGHLRDLRRAGRNHIWGYVARNLSRPLWLSSAPQRCEVIVGNPPWLAYRHMVPHLQARFRDECRRRGLWTGGRLATHQDLSGYFFARCAELYLREGGTIALVMPYGVFSRPAFASFRSGRFDTVEVRIDAAWAFDETVQPLFPIPSAVVFGRRTAADALPISVTAFTGRLPRRDASPEEARHRLSERSAPWPGRAALSGLSPYRRAFRQGATMVPRRLCLVERVATGRLGANPLTPLVESRSSKLEKRPWSALPPLRQAVEACFLRPLYLGETVLPYRVTTPPLAVIPWEEGSDGLLDAHAASERGYPGLARWLDAGERLWREHSRSSLTLQQRWDYVDALRCQLPPAQVRVVYAKSGILLAAAIVEDDKAFIDHKLYWAAFERYSEALYVTAFLNSEWIRQRIAALQSRGRFGTRDVDKLVLELPIPRFDATKPLHLQLMRTALEAERIAGAVPLPDGLYFVRSRGRIRRALAEAGVAQEIDRLVAALLPGD
jgi:SAM-dependent methyltransferase